MNTEYTAGPRGFRATGNDIARKMSLSQVGPAPVPPPDGRYSPEYDGYSDPNEDPSYEYRYRTDTASKVEIADSRGDVVGQYVYLDDDGERHVVKYDAGAEKGFNVRTAFPDNNIPTPLFFPGRGRIPPRGRSSILQHRNGAYRFTAVGPDSRREECSDSENYRRGSYVYLDDKGIQRTVIYEAGPNIGFRIITNPAASIPRCPPSKGSPGWQNVPIAVGTDGPYYQPGFGAPSPNVPYRPPEIFDTLGTKYPQVPYGSTTIRPGGVTGKPSKPSRRPPTASTTRPTTYRPPGSSTLPDLDEFTILIPDPIPPGPRPPKPTPGGVGSTQSPYGGSTVGSTVPGSTTSGGGVTGGPNRGSTRPPPRRPSDGGGLDDSGYPGSGSGNIGGGSGGGTGNRGGGSGGSGNRGGSGGSGNRGGSGGSGNRGGSGGSGGSSAGSGRPYESSGGSGQKNPIFDKTFDITTHRGYPSSTLGPRPTKPSISVGNNEGNDGGIFGGGDDSGEDKRPGIPDGYSPRPPLYPYPPPFDGYHYSCCRDRIYVDPAPGDRFSRARPIRTYIQSIDLPAEDNDGPGRAENPSVALERHVRDQERRRQRSRRRRRRRSVP